jgi:hypothetical protein
VDVGTGPIGRYAYIVVNVSGLLDANVVGDPNTNRWIGADPREIQLNTTLLPDLADTNLFLTSRASNIRYETLKDLAEHSAGITTNLSNFEVFSRAPDGMQPDGVTPKVYIGGSVADLQANHDAITNAFIKCGIVAPNSWGYTPAMAAEAAYCALVDYVDAGSVLTNTAMVGPFNRPSSKAVPQISSIYMQMDYKRSPLNSPVPPFTTTNWVHAVTNTFNICFAYPYLSPPAAAMSNLEAWVKVTYSTATLPPPTPILWLPFFPSLPPFYTYTTNLTISYLSPWYGVSSALGVRVPNTVTATNTTCMLNFKATVEVEVRDKTTPSIVYDKFTTPVVLANACTFTNTGSYTNWAETFDPRINWNGTDTNQWRMFHDFAYTNASLDTLPLAGYKRTRPSVPGQVYSPPFGGYLVQHALSNYTAASALQLVADGIRLKPGDEPNWDPINLQPNAYVANRPLQTVGELGFLPINRLLTISLYSHNHNNTYGLLPASGYHPVLDYFTVHPPTNRAARGLVSLGSCNTNVHASVFLGVPVQEWKGVSASACITNASDVMTFVSPWVNSCQANGIQHLSDLALIWSNATVLGNLAGSQIPAGNQGPAHAIGEAIHAATGGNWMFGEFEREALIRNTAELYTTRHQFFTIIVRADSLTTKYGFGDVKNSHTLGSAQAVFQVWRDPVKGADGRHHCFVRLFKVL